MLETLIVGLNLYTAHFDESKGFNNETPGAYVAYRVSDSELCLPMSGVYRNSERAISPWIACRFASGPFRLDIGVVGGYMARRVTPLVIPSVAVPLGEKTSFNIGVIPIKDGGVHFSVEKGF